MGLYPMCNCRRKSKMVLFCKLKLPSVYIEGNIAFQDNQARFSGRGMFRENRLFLHTDAKYLLLRSSCQIPDFKRFGYYFVNAVALLVMKLRFTFIFHPYIFLILH